MGSRGLVVTEDEYLKLLDLTAGQNRQLESGYLTRQIILSATPGNLWAIELVRQWRAEANEPKEGDDA